MAFTIYDSPDVVTPGYNPMWFEVYSTNYDEDAMRYIFKLYVNGNLVSTSKLFPRPNYRCLYDPQPIVKNYLDGKRVDYTNGVADAQDGYVAEFYVEFYEEYDIAGVVTESVLLDTSSTSRCYEMVNNEQHISAGDFINEYTPHYISSTPVNVSLAKYSGPRVQALDSWTLDNSKPILPNDTYTITEYDRTTLSIIAKHADSLYAIDNLIIRTYTYSGEVKTFNFDLTSIVSSDILHIPVGITDINDFIDTMSVTINCPVALTEYIVQDEDYAYAVELKTAAVGGRYIYQPIIFRIVEPCDTYERYTVMYKTDIGGWWYIPFQKKSFYTEENSRTNIQLYRGNNDDGTFMQKPVINMQGSGTYTLTTDWLINDNFIQEVQDLLRSPVVYINVRQPDNSIIEIPVTVATSSYQVKTTKQDKMIQYTIEFKEAFTKKFAI